MRCLPLDELAASQRADELPVARLNPSSHRYDDWPADPVPTFVGVVVDPRVAVRERELPAVIRIVNHEVRIAADLHRSLPWIHPEDARCLRAARVDHRVEIDPAGCHAVRVNQIDALLNARYSVGNPRERVATHLLLILEAKGRVVRADRADRAGLETVPEHVLVAFLPERR